MCEDAWTTLQLPENRFQTPKYLHAVVSAKHPSVTLKQIKSALATHQRRKIALSTPGQVMELIRANTITQVRERPEDDASPFFFGSVMTMVQARTRFHAQKEGMIAAFGRMLLEQRQELASLIPAVSGPAPANPARDVVNTGSHQCHFQGMAEAAEALPGQPSALHFSSGWDL